MAASARAQSYYTYVGTAEGQLPLPDWHKSRWAGPAERRRRQADGGKQSNISVGCLKLIDVDEGRETTRKDEQRERERESKGQSLAVVGAARLAWTTFACLSNIVVVVVGIVGAPEERQRAAKQAGGCFSAASNPNDSKVREHVHNVPTISSPLAHIKGRPSQTSPRPPAARRGSWATTLKYQMSSSSLSSFLSSSASSGRLIAMDPDGTMTTTNRHVMGANFTLAGSICTIGDKDGPEFGLKLRLKKS